MSDVFEGAKADLIFDSCQKFFQTLAVGRSIGECRLFATLIPLK